MSLQGHRTVSRLGYKDYIKSDAWRQVKRRYLRSRLPKECFVCIRAFDNSFHFHHRTYKNLGRERLLDIVPVCAGCHEAVHELQKITGMPFKASHNPSAASIQEKGKTIKASMSLRDRRARQIA